MRSSNQSKPLSLQFSTLVHENKSMHEMFFPFPSGKLCQIVISLNLLHAACGVYQGSPAWWTQTRQPLCLLKASLCPRSGCPCTKTSVFFLTYGICWICWIMDEYCRDCVGSKMFSVLQPCTSQVIVLQDESRLPYQVHVENLCYAYTNMSNHKYAITKMTYYDTIWQLWVCYFCWIIDFRDYDLK